MGWFSEELKTANFHNLEATGLRGKVGCFPLHNHLGWNFQKPKANAEYIWKITPFMYRINGPDRCPPLVKASGEGRKGVKLHEAPILKYLLHKIG